MIHVHEFTVSFFCAFLPFCCCCWVFASLPPFLSSKLNSDRKGSDLQAIAFSFIRSIIDESLPINFVRHA